MQYQVPMHGQENIVTKNCGSIFCRFVNDCLQQYNNTSCAVLYCTDNNNNNKDDDDEDDDDVNNSSSRSTQSTASNSNWHTYFTNTAVLLSTDLQYYKKQMAKKNEHRLTVV